MTKKLVVGGVLLVLAVLGVSFVASRDDGATPAPPARDVPVPPPERTPPESAPTRTRVRTEPDVPADAPVDGPADAPAADETLAPSTESPEQPTVEELLEAPIPAFSLQSEPMKRALGLLSAMTKVPVHLDADVAAALEKVPLTLEMQSVKAGLIFDVMSRIAGLTVAVEEDRIVLHKQGAAWKPEMATVKIEPIVPDPNAPTTFTVRGRVLDEDGRSIPDVAILSGPSRVLARTDESGSYSFEIGQRRLQLRAVRPMRVRSARFNTRAEYGETIEHDFVLGPPAGALALIVLSSSGEPPEGARVRLTWGDDATSDFEDRIVDGTGVVRCDFVPEGDVTIRVTDKNHAPVTETIAIRVGISSEHEIVLSQVSLADRLRDERVSFSFRESSLRDVTDYLSHVKGVNLIVSPSLRQAAYQTHITMTVKDATLLSVLEDLCGALPSATFEVKGRYVLIKPKPQ